MVKIKGSVIIDAMKWVREHHGQDRFDRIISLLGPEAKNMFQQPILSFHWCSFDAYIEFLEICLREEWKGDTNWIVNSAEDIVKKQLSGIYRLFIKLGSPEFLIKKMSLVGNTYFQGVEAEVEVVESGKATVKYVGYKPHHAIFEYALIGWYRKALELSGAKNVKVEFITPIKAGKGYAKSSITWTGK